MEPVWGQGDVGKNGGMSRFVFLPVDSECDQLVKQRVTVKDAEEGGPLAFTMRDFGQALRQERGGGSVWVCVCAGLHHTEHNDKQKNFSVIHGCPAPFKI